MDLLNQDILYYWSIPFFTIVILLEMYLSYRQKAKNYEFKDVATNLYFALANLGIDLIIKGASFFLMGLCFHYRIINWEDQNWLYWALVFIGTDFMYYIAHYVDHSSRFFWAVHVTHHNSEFFNISTGFRSSVLQPFYRNFYFLPMVFLGFEPLHILFCYAVGQIYGTLYHTTLIKSRKSLLGYIFVTPSHHRVHHASNIKYLDKNMGTVFIIWDRIFGTFQAEESETEYEKLKFGLTTNVEDKGPINIIFHEWKEIFKDFFVRKKHLPLSTRLKYVFMPPGWSHDGSTKTSRELQAELYKQEIKTQSN